MPLSISNAAPAGVVGVPYWWVDRASGGSAPYTYSITAGSLPPGLTLDPATGYITGTPTTGSVPGITYNFTVHAVDSFAVTGDRADSIVIFSQQNYLMTMPPGNQGTPYSFQVDSDFADSLITFVWGAPDPPYTFDGISGGGTHINWGGAGNPGGISISAGGLISGTPSNASNPATAPAQYSGTFGVVPATMGHGVSTTLLVHFDGPLPPAPTCSLSGTPLTIALAQSAVLSWTVTGTATSASIDNGVGAVSPTGGSVSVSPTVTTTYHLTVTGPGGSSNCQVTITVVIPPPPPPGGQAAILEFVPFGGNGSYPGLLPGHGNVYTTPQDPDGDPILLTDNDYGQIFPYYVTYYFVEREQEQALQLGSHRKMISYIMASLTGVGNMTITALINTLTNLWPINVTRALAATAIVETEWSGASATGNRIALKFASSPISGTDNSFELEKLAVAMKPVTHLPVRGSAT